MHLWVLVWLYWVNLEEATGEMCRSAHIKLELREFHCAPVDFLFHCGYVLAGVMQHVTSLPPEACSKVLCVEHTLLFHLAVGSKELDWWKRDTGWVTPFQLTPCFVTPVITCTGPQGPRCVFLRWSWLSVWSETWFTLLPELAAPCLLSQTGRIAWDQSHYWFHCLSHCKRVHSWSL